VLLETRIVERRPRGVVAGYQPRRVPVGERDRMYGAALEHRGVQLKRIITVMRTPGRKRIFVLRSHARILVAGRARQMKRLGRVGLQWPPARPMVFGCKGSDGSLRDHLLNFR